jgi:hypothetical protein
VELLHTLRPVGLLHSSAAMNWCALAAKSGRSWRRVRLLI